MIELVVFGLATAGLLVSGAAVVLARSPLRAALYLIAGLCCSGFANPSGWKPWPEPIHGRALCG